jgi:phosphoribosylformylglycinamidine synthase
VRSAHDCSEGGIAIALAESCISGQLGADITLESQNQRPDVLLFGEGASRILVAIAPDMQTEWEKFLGEHLGQTWQKLGTVGQVQGNLQISLSEDEIIIDLAIAEMMEIWSEAIARRLG